MSKEQIILSLTWAVTIISLLLFIPKNKIREAIVAFLFKQLLTWLTGLTVVETKLIAYPVRLFPYANKTSFTFEYFVFPVLCAFFNIYYPEQSGLKIKFIYYGSFCTAMTIYEVILEKQTLLIKYIHWDWYLTWFTLFLTFLASRWFYRWFFHIKAKTII